MEFHRFSADQLHPPDTHRLLMVLLAESSHRMVADVTPPSSFKKGDRERRGQGMCFCGEERNENRRSLTVYEEINDLCKCFSESEDMRMRVKRDPKHRENIESPAIDVAEKGKRRDNENQSNLIEGV